MFFFNAGQTFTPEVFIQCKNVWGPGSRAVIFDIPLRRFTVILLITFDFEHFLT